MSKDLFIQFRRETDALEIRIFLSHFIFQLQYEIKLPLD